MTQNFCRFCGEQLVNTFVNLGMSPISNAYICEDQMFMHESFYPLHAFVCSRCFLVQVIDVKTPNDIFSEYAYFSSYSDTWLKHCEEYVKLVTKKFEVGRESCVIELASNDGYLLQYFKHMGIQVIGIEPALNVAKVARDKGIETITDFFGSILARELVSKGIQADLLIGNNVLAHVPDINDFVKGMKILLKHHGVITMEFPHLIKLIELNQFDTIYHEHFSYFSFTTVLKIFESHDFTIFDVDEIPTHGGSLRIYASHKQDNTKHIKSSVSKLLAYEEKAGLSRVETYESFEKSTVIMKHELLSLLIKLKKKGKSIAGYGAPAKGNTLLNYCGIRRDFLDYTVDKNPYKQGKYLPGSHIPIYSPEKLMETKPDYVLILPWNLREEIIEQIGFIRNWGGKFIVPIPEVEVF